MANIIKAMKLDFDLVKVYVKAICFTNIFVEIKIRIHKIDS